MKKHLLEVTVAIENMDTVMSFIEEHTLSLENQKIVQQLIMVVEELALNVFTYTYDGIQGKFSLSIANDLERRLVVMEFRDSGKPYNSLLLQDPTLNVPLSEREIGGLGMGAC